MKKLDSVVFQFVRTALNWAKNNRVLTVLILIAIATLLTVRVEIDIDQDKKTNINWTWAGWTGFGEDLTINTEKNAKHKIVKTVEIQQSGKTFWDLLQLFGTVALPVLLLFLANRFQQREKQRTDANQLEQENKKELQKEIAEDNQRGQALENYLDRIADILLDQQPFGLDRNNPAEKLKYDTVLDIIRARTLEILRRFSRDENNVDRERKSRIFKFLYDVELLYNSDEIVEIGTTYKPVLDLSDADFSGVNLSGVFLDGVNLSGINLSKANLNGAYFYECDLSKANLNGVELIGASITSSNLTLTKLIGATLIEASLKGTKLAWANLEGATLSSVDMRKTDFSGVNLKNTTITDSSLCGATLTVGIKDAKFRDNRYDEETKFPDDFDPELHGMLKVPLRREREEF